MKHEIGVSEKFFKGTNLIFNGLLKLLCVEHWCCHRHVILLMPMGGAIKALAHYNDFHNDFFQKIVAKIVAHI